MVPVCVLKLLFLAEARRSRHVEVWFSHPRLGNSRFDMTTEYERQRLLNISKNKELLNGLVLPRSKEDGRLTATPSSRPTKRQKLEPPPATRVSARLSTQPKPSYKEDNTPLSTVSSSLKIAKAPAPRKPSTLSEEEAQEMIQRWIWEATAPLPTRSENGTLHFPDHLDVTSPFYCSGTNLSSLPI